jgi:predicted nucleic acid-binding protein
MSTKAEIYCLDANVLIQAWQKYYSPKFCPDYWKVLNKLGDEGRVFIPEMVYEEIVRTEDDLADWLKKSKISVRKIDEAVTKHLQSIYSKNVLHKNLVDNTKSRSIADPWVIAHALNEKATIVTKEEKVTAQNSIKIKIPNVCDNMGVRWINDFQLIEELAIYFNCGIK